MEERREGGGREGGGREGGGREGGGREGGGREGGRREGKGRSRRRKERGEGEGRCLIQYYKKHRTLQYHFVAHINITMDSTSRNV